MGIKVITSNRKAFHEYTISDKVEAGISLVGTEVKSVRDGRVNLSAGWVDIQNEEAFLVDAQISPYSHGNQMNHEEKRRRKLLLHRNEIIRLEAKIAEKGMTVVPLKMYFKGQFIKVEIGVGKGKKLHDKRQTQKKKEADRDIARAMRNR